MNSIEDLARLFDLTYSYEHSSNEELIKTIDTINQKFQEHVIAKTVHTLYSKEKMSQGYAGQPLINAPFEFFLWNRYYRQLYRPVFHKGWNFEFVHGHDYHDQTHKNIVNLDEDNDLGKKIQDNQGNYHFLYTKEDKITFALEQGTSAGTTSLETVRFENAQGLSDYTRESSSSTAPHGLMFAEESTTVTSNEGKTSEKDLDPKALREILKIIEEKRTELLKRGYQEASEAAKILYDSIDQKIHSLCSQEITLEQFKSDCHDLINQARPELEKHRGWKQLLGNLALAIVDMGVFYIVAGLINKATTGHFLFFKTDSATKLDKLEESLNAFSHE